MGGFGEDLVELRVVAGRNVSGDVVRPLGMHGTGPVGQRGVVADDGIDGIDLDLDEVAGVLGDVARLGDDEGDRLAGEAHVAVGQNPERTPALAALEVDPALDDVAVEIGAGEDGDDSGELSRRGRRRAP